MEKIFTDLQKTKLNTSDTLIEWIMKAKLGGTAEDMRSVKKLFYSAYNPNNVDFVKFKSIIEDLTHANNLNIEEVKKKLAATGPCLCTPDE